MIDFTKELPIPFSDVPKLPWIRGRVRVAAGSHRRHRLNVATVYRWASRGLRGHRLEYVQLGGTRVTTEAALLRFFESLTQPHSGQARYPRPSGNESARVEKELDAAGI